MKAPRSARPPMPSEHEIGERSVRDAMPATPRIEQVADPLQEIRNRQRMLAAARNEAPQPTAPTAPIAMPRPRLERWPETAPHVPHRTAAERTDVPLREIVDALSNLRQDLKQDIADGIEVGRASAAAQDHRIDDDLRHNLARLADSIHVLDQRGGPAADALRAEYEELRAAIGGLAREESLWHLDSRWQGIEERIVGLDTRDLREELAGLAYRIDEIKGQLGTMSDSPAIRAMEDKLLAVAGAMEQIGAHMRPNDALTEQFSVLDERLDEISRAIAANGRASAGSALDHTALQRLENRIATLADQIDGIGRNSFIGTAEDLSQRIEALSHQIEQLSNEEGAIRLEERLEQLLHMLSQPGGSYGQADFAGHLADISEKIEGLGEGEVNGALLERLDQLVRRIDQLENRGSLAAPAFEPSAIGRIEERLSDIAARLDETVHGPIGDSPALKSLEAQIAHLSALMSEPSRAAAHAAPEIENRVTALESYMSTNDEYIIEAARQAAEAVVESFARRGSAGPSAVDATALAALAEDLRHLEELTRNTEERSQHTLDALHSTLVQIADRLDAMEDRMATPLPPAFAMPVLETAAPVHAPYAEQKPGVEARPLAEPDNVHDDLIRSLAGSTAHAGGRQAVSAGPEDDQHPDDVSVAPDEPAVAVQASASPKAGLLAQISRRLRPGPKQAPSKPGRTLIDPAPSLDPVDLLPPERENEPLEPGSGAPDVRQILERVRASQAAAGNDRDQAAVGDRADYIAAARRAAKAAAMETDPAFEGVKGRKKGKGKAAGRSTGSALSRHRRPIMMAVGAVLLVLMAVPLVKNLASQDAAPQPPVVKEMPAQDQASAQGGTSTSPVETASEEPLAVRAGPEVAEQAAITAPAENAAGLETSATPPPAVEATPLLEPRPAEGVAATLERPEGGEQQAEAATAPEAEPASPAIVVPASIGPESLAKAAQSGDPVALFEIGARYTEGRGVGVDLAEAANWYKLAADRGSAPAQYRLGNLFEKGNGIEKDLDKAMAYYNRAADAGNASAMHNLAVLSASGARGEPDYAAAIDWFRKAAELGVSDSQFNLAILYARGNGAPQDLVESYKWFAIAAKGGDTDAAQKRDEVAKAMRKEQVDAARTAADAWKPQTPKAEANSVQLPDEWAGEKPVKTSSVDMEKAIRNIQAILNKNGFEAGEPDGKMGQRTIGAIKAFQTSVGQEATGKINDALVKELLARNT